METAAPAAIPMVKVVEVSSEELHSDAFTKGAFFDGPDAMTCTMEEFLAANAEGLSDDEVAKVRALEVDFFSYFGGGAAGFFGVLRTA